MISNENSKKKKSKKLHKHAKRSRDNRSEIVSVQSTEESESSEGIFYRKRVKIHVALLPALLGPKVPSHLLNAVKNLVLTYVPGMEGMLLAYSKLRMSKKCVRGGIIVGDYPYVLYEMTAECLVFCPKEGMVLEGRVKVCDISHVEIQILSLPLCYLNAVVSAKTMRDAGYSFESSQWSKYMDDGGTARGVAIGTDQDVSFLLEKITECGQMLLLEGRVV